MKIIFRVLEMRLGFDDRELKTFDTYEDAEAFIKHEYINTQLINRNRNRRMKIEKVYMLEEKA